MTSLRRSEAPTLWWSYVVIVADCSMYIELYHVICNVTSCTLTRDVYRCLYIIRSMPWSCVVSAVVVVAAAAADCDSVLCGPRDRVDFTLYPAWQGSRYATWLLLCVTVATVSFLLSLRSVPSITACTSPALCRSLRLVWSYTSRRFLSIYKRFPATFTAARAPLPSADHAWTTRDGEEESNQTTCLDHTSHQPDGHEA